MRQRNGAASLEHDGKAPMREDGRDRIEVHVAGVCVRPIKGRWQVLIAKRTQHRSLYPGKWECGGGHVRYGEDFQQALKRQFFEEFGIDIEPEDLLEAYAIPVRDQRFIPGLRFLCSAATDAQVRLNRREFSSYRWVPFPVPKLPWIEGVKKMLDALATEFVNAPTNKQLVFRKPAASAAQRRLALVRPNQDSAG